MALLIIFYIRFIVSRIWVYRFDSNFITCNW